MIQSLYQQSIISIAELTRAHIDQVLALGSRYKQGLIQTEPLKGKIIASCFFEPSTRTRLSFESAALRLGGKVIGFADSHNTSLSGKGESLSDTLKIIGSYADAMVIRHPQEGSARLASKVAGIPVINAGDGANQHPSQTLLDLFTMQETQQRLEGLHVGLVGDLKHARTIHSLVQAAALYDMRLYFVAPAALSLPESLAFELKRKGVKFSFHSSISDIMDKLDILYLTRLQKERFTHEYQEADFLKLSLQVQDLAQARPNLKILHPLPRREELPLSVDASPHAYYFQQAHNGIYVRQALLQLILNQEVI